MLLITQLSSHLMWKFLKKYQILSNTYSQIEFYLNFWVKLHFYSTWTGLMLHCNPEIECISACLVQSQTSFIIAIGHQMRVTFQVNCVKLDLKCKVSQVNLLKIALISYLAFKGNKIVFLDLQMLKTLF